MEALNIQNLRKKSAEILKAEIGALMFNLGKTHIGFWEEKNEEKNNVKYFTLDDIFKNNFKTKYGYEIFKDYRNYYSKDKPDTPFWKEVKRFGGNRLKEFFNSDVLLDCGNLRKNRLKIYHIAYGDAIGKVLKEDSGDQQPIIDFVENIFFKGCENINSGMDKGFPREQMKKLWLSNAFGAYKSEVNDCHLDASRENFFAELSGILDGFRKPLADYEDFAWRRLRRFIQDKIRNWYSNIRSDSRAPLNDITLWEQAYMTASMFKAALAAICLDSSPDGMLYQQYMDRPSSVRWRIMGVQYDKLGLSEKALKSHFIDWYRIACERADNMVKRIVEEQYAVGNEIYRDETGIYFAVAENLAGNQKDYKDYLDGDKQDENRLYFLHQDMAELQKDILNVFKHVFGKETFPAIFLTEASRGLYALTDMISKAPENYLMPASWDMPSIDDSKGSFKTICRICGMEMVCEDKNGDKTKLDACDKCKARMKNRLDDWVKNPAGETIWTGDLQDKNGRIALITMKFELEEWQNGNMLSTALVNIGHKYNYSDLYAKMLETLRSVRAVKLEEKREYERLENEIKSLKMKQEKKNEILEHFRTGDKSVYEIYKILYEKYNDRLKSINFNLDDKLIEFLQRIDNVLDGISEKLESKFKIDYKLKKLRDRSPINTLVRNNRDFDKYVKIFKFSIFEHLAEEAYNHDLNEFIAQVFIQTCKGTGWKGLVDRKMGQGTVDWDTERIIWDQVTDDGIKFMAEIMLQFLLRKPPSPARLSRIWSSTREYLDKLKAILEKDLVQKWRGKRIVWEAAAAKDGEYEYAGLEFWAKDCRVYLISSLERAIPVLRKYPGKFSREEEDKIKKMISNGDMSWLKDEIQITGLSKSEEKVSLNKARASYSCFIPLYSITEPSPASWQFIIPADCIPGFVDTAKKLYFKKFKYVCGKLPIHIGIIVQNYKMPLYVGIKALRSMRRNIRRLQDIEICVDKDEWPVLPIGKSGKDYLYEQNDNMAMYYGLYPLKATGGSYRFYMRPEDDEPSYLDYPSQVPDEAKIKAYPCTIDFEFIDSNIRRDDIFYEKGKRIDGLKQNRPYCWEEWDHFKNFIQLAEDSKTAGRLHKMAELVYRKLSEWDDSDAVKKLVLSAITNIFGLNDEKTKEKQQKFAGFFGKRGWEEVINMPPNEFENGMKRFIDMFEFWRSIKK
ncbi:MAG: CRISPR-associated protein Csx11 [Tepidanaerobacteraceae bacterium]|jgi:CRISPR-associated Csx11 family protein|nr:CRISPR-associated protein Csx11 [Tepidanaerobacteraceae bacterium]